MGINYFKQKPELKDHVFAARDYFRDECMSNDMALNRNKLKSIKYFQALYWSYEGYDIERVAKYFKVSESTICQQVRRAQCRVEQYVKLKDMGLL